MEKAELKSFGKPDEVREFPKGRMEVIKIGGAMIGRAVFEPGWRWATSVQPLAKTTSCEAPHFQYHVSGVLRIKMDGGADLRGGGEGAGRRRRASLDAELLKDVLQMLACCMRADIEDEPDLGVR